MKTSMRSVDYVSVLMVCLAAAWLGSPGAHAVTTTWTTGASSWYTGGNWDNGVPTAADAAVVPSGTAQVATSSSTATASSLTVKGASGTVEVSAGTLNVGGNVQLGVDWVNAPTLRQTGGDVSISGDLIMGVYPQNNSPSLRIGSGAGSFSVNNISFATSTLHTVDIQGGAVNVSGTFGSGEAMLSPFSLTMTGGTVTAANMNVGARYNNSAAPVAQQNGSDVSVAGTMTVRGVNVKYELMKGTLAIGKGGRLTIGGGDQYGAGPGQVLFNLSATGPTSLVEYGAGTGAGLVLRDYYTGYGMAQVGNAIGTFRGWGTVGFSGTLDNSGKVIADGGGTDHTLDMSSFAAVANTLENLSANGSTATGWFAQNRGKLVLPAIAVPGSGSVNWGEASGDTAPDLINSVRLTSVGVTSGTLGISLLADDRSDVAAPLISLAGLNPPYTSDTVGLFKLDPSTFDLGLGGTLAFSIRYDDSTLPAGAEQRLGLWLYNGSSWSDIRLGIDPTNKWITSTGLTTLGSGASAGLIAVTIPEPGALSLLALGALTLLRRRRGR